MLSLSKGKKSAFNFNALDNDSKYKHKLTSEALSKFSNSKSVHNRSSMARDVVSDRRSVSNPRESDMISKIASSLMNHSNNILSDSSANFRDTPSQEEEYLKQQLYLRLLEMPTHQME